MGDCLENHPVAKLIIYSLLINNFAFFEKIMTTRNIFKKYS